MQTIKTRLFMENQTNLEKLNDKVSQILQQYHSLKGENEVLQNEVAKLKADNELKTQEIEKLTEQNIMKDLEIEEIVNKIESILG
jgi:cell division protein FtsB